MNVFAAIIVDEFGNTLKVRYNPTQFLPEDEKHFLLEKKEFNKTYRNIFCLFIILFTSIRNSKIKY